jgi:hypothetical protein
MQTKGRCIHIGCEHDRGHTDGNEIAGARRSSGALENSRIESAPCAVVILVAVSTTFRTCSVKPLFKGIEVYWDGLGCILTYGGIKSLSIPSNPHVL